MGFGKILLSLVKSPKLSYAALRSKISMYSFKSEAFKSTSFKKLFSDKYTYKGNKPNTVFCINRKTGAQVPITVEQSISKLEKETKEIYTFRNLSGENIGSKEFSFSKNPDGKMTIMPGSMKNETDDIIGIGIRGDQIQIERALTNGITHIPRESAPQATLFHAKMGFVPTTGELVPVNSYKDAISEMKAHNIGWLYETEDKIKPIITMRDGKFYLDINKTTGCANLQEVKHRMKNSSEIRIGLLGNQADMELSKSALRKWKKVIGNNKIIQNSA